ncbi:MAG: family 10 glycosylhydrolase [Weeksellaceae bacterium]|nr:family 10 glycosylhydrolase [Weeksellaceae bacterium]
MFLLVGITSCATQKRKKKSTPHRVATPPKKPQAPKPKTPAATPTQPESPAAPEIVEEEPLIVDLPIVDREFRGVWIATVANINWPSTRFLSSEQQQQEAIDILDMLEQHNFNAVVLQVRPSADALYQSVLEPWSYFLTGETGRAPEPFYDPLEFWIEEAHKRGIELHAWINPYRAHHTAGGKVNQSSMASSASDIVVRLQNGTYWFDPGNIKTQHHISMVVRDLVMRYDLDAIHLDDYFYPYREYNGGKDFPDNASYNSYRREGGELSRADWRRDNVNRIIQRLHYEIKEIKPHVKFGISPFGIWKTGFPAGIKGLSQYDELYADAKLWLNEGWLDYFSPQLYWSINKPAQSYTSLLQWWQTENTKSRHLWPGLNTVGVKDVPNRTEEIVNQVKFAQNLLHDSKGVIHYSLAGLQNKDDMLHRLRHEAYAQKALTPLSPWINFDKIPAPELEIDHDGNHWHLNWHLQEAADVFQWVVYKQYGTEWQTEIYASDVLSITLDNKHHHQKLNTIAVQAVDRLGNLGEYKAIRTN